MNCIKHLFFILITLASCTSKLDGDKNLSNDCYRCWRRDVLFIDTLEKTVDIDSIAYKKFRDHDYTVIEMGLPTDEKRELFIHTYAKVRYDIKIIGGGDVGSRTYDRYNETMWKLLYDKYKIDRGTFYVECMEKYKRFKEENELK